MGKLSKFFRRRQRERFAPAIMAGLRPLASSELVQAHVQQRLAWAHPQRQRSVYYQEAAPALRPAAGFGVKAIAFYSWPVPWPQVAAAQPQYVGHEQPHMPGAPGFYDLRAPGVLRDQVAMARSFGVHAFCFPCAGDTGAAVANEALAQFVSEPTLDLGFCCALTGDAQQAPTGTDEPGSAVIQALTSCFADPRYIKIDGRPMLLVQGLGECADAQAATQRWRAQAVRSGWPGLYLVAMREGAVAEPAAYGCDAAVEVPPQQLQAVDITGKMAWLNGVHTGKVYDYMESALRMGAATSEGHRLFKTVMPSWDSEAAQPGRGIAFQGSTPRAFAQWLRTAARWALRNPQGERFVFVNAWNDWAHGAYLEPDTRHGYAYLNALSATLAELDSSETLASFARTMNSGFRKAHDVVIFAHFFYEDVLDDMLDAYLVNLAGLADLHVSVTENMAVSSLARLHAVFPNMRVHLCENRGRDVKPFIEMYRLAAHDGYEVAFKLHGKRSPHLGNGAAWREQLVDPLLGSRAVFEQHVATLKSGAKAVMLVPQSALHQLNEAGFNQRWLDELLRQTGHAERAGRYKWKFAAGTMFAFQFKALDALLNEDAISLACFEAEAGQLDGTYAHAMERMLGLFATAQGGKIASC